MKEQYTYLVRKTFDIHALEFDKWFTKNRELYISELKALKAARPRGLILDIGMGSGAFASKIGVYVGIDISLEILKIGQRKGVEVIQADARALPFREDIFDTVIITFTICFVKNPLGMLLESGRVIKENGRLILGEITLDSAWGKFYSREGRRGHRFYKVANFLTLNETMSLLTKAGFKIEKAIATISYGPEDKPRVEDPIELLKHEIDKIKRYGFIILVSNYH